VLRVTIMIATIAAELRAADPRLETAGQVVEAVGIEPASDHLVSHDSIAITRNGLDAETPLNPSESVLPDQLGTRVPNSRHADALLVPVRRAWGVLRVV
jgi:hypothetical protein